MTTAKRSQENYISTGEQLQSVVWGIEILI